LTERMRRLSFCGSASNSEPKSGFLSNGHPSGKNPPLSNSVRLAGDVSGASQSTCEALTSGRMARWPALRSAFGSDFTPALGNICANKAKEHRQGQDDAEIGTTHLSPGTYRIGAADPFGVLMHDIEAALAGHLPEVVQLRLGVLVKGADPQIQDGTFHLRCPLLCGVKDRCLAAGHGYSSQAPQQMIASEPIVSWSTCRESAMARSCSGRGTSPFSTASRSLNSMPAIFCLYASLSPGRRMGIPPLRLAPVPGSSRRRLPSEYGPPSDGTDPVPSAQNPLQYHR